MKKFLIILGIAIVIIWIVEWSAEHDKKVEVAAQKYEACVKSQYGVSPAFYYQEKGVYPECK